MSRWKKIIQEKGISYFALLLISIGILSRLILFFQNRNLIIDEANVVRNIFERHYGELLSPLSYCQYAPPVFLWGLETFSIFFGYSEKAMRLLPLLTGIGSLFVFRALLKQILPARSLWISLGLFCFAPILVKYSVEVKQYVPDTLIGITLIYTALKTDIFHLSGKQFLLRWVLIGSIAIWSSQPSVFILAGIGLYYFILVCRQKKWHLLLPLSLIGIAWLTNFVCYYLTILKSQINSEYLQNYHAPYFLYALPQNAQEWRHNWLRIREIICNTGGYNMVSLYACALLIAAGAWNLYRQNLARFVLISGPVLLTIIAAALHQFSLIDRVALFILPLLMILVGFGLDFFMRIGKGLQYPAIFAGIYMLYLYNFSSLLYKRFEFHELTKGLDYIVQQKGTGKELYVDCASRDTYIYYTQVHPDSMQYQTLKGAYLFEWGIENFPEISAAQKTERSFYIFTGGDSMQRERHLAEIRMNCKQTGFFEHAACFVYTFKKP